MSTTVTFQAKLAEEAELLNAPDQKGLVGCRVLGTRRRSQDCAGKGGNDKGTSHHAEKVVGTRFGAVGLSLGYRSAQIERLSARVAATGAAG